MGEFVSSYRVRRRAFLAGLGGAVGLKTLLGNLEASAQGAPPPPRLLVIHWPLGTLMQRFLPTPNGEGFTVSPILAPFDAAGLTPDMTVLFGLSHGFRGMGGGNEDGTVFAVTGADSPGTRSNGGEPDDGVAGGPSFDQIFLKHVPELQRPGRSFVNATADGRVFSYELSTQILSYGYETQAVQSQRPGGTITEHRPNLPHRKPLILYNDLFRSMIPGAEPDAALRALRLRKSVLDSALGELSRIHDLSPSSEWEKLDIHADAIRTLELELQGSIDQGGMNACVPPTAPDSSLEAKIGNGPIVLSAVDQEDATSVAAIGKAHAAVIRAAFQCDLIRVGTLMWCPSTNHVAFGGMNPDDPDAIYEMGSYIYGSQDFAVFAGPPPVSGSLHAFYETMSAMYTWFSQQTADVLAEFKAATDVFGGKLLDSTIVPYITEEADPTDRRSPLPACIFGGRALGMQGGKFMDFSKTAIRSNNDFWMTIAQAYLKTADPLSVLSDEVFVKTGVAPIDGLWLPPA